MPLCSKFVPPAEPEIFLSSWRAYETSDGLMHLVGFDSVSRGRVSWAIGAFDHDAMRAFTSDGNTYRLVGKPGAFWEVERVWECWFQANCAGAVTDVTELLIAGSAVDV